nr:MAG TPA: hypothetical protein [Caudoviricetes sp.]DAH98259.1 MAG TPA: hypothetical protein [Caudoviricetes sp.]
MLLWSIICGRLVLIRQGYGLRSALLVFNHSRKLPGFIGSAWYRLPVLSLVGLCRRKSLNYSRLQ